VARALLVTGDLQLSYDWIPEAAAYFGAPPEVQVNVYPLEGQRLDTRSEISSAPSVRAGGSAVATQAEVVQGNRAPSREIRAHGPDLRIATELGLSLLLSPGRGVTGGRGRR